VTWGYLDRLTLNSLARGRLPKERLPQVDSHLRSSAVSVRGEGRRGVNSGTPSRTTPAPPAPVVVRAAARRLRRRRQRDGRGRPDAPAAPESAAALEVPPPPVEFTPVALQPVPGPPELTPSRPERIVPDLCPLDAGSRPGRVGAAASALATASKQSARGAGQCGSSRVCVVEAVEATGGVLRWAAGPANLD
jgi:hypothetical protein